MRKHLSWLIALSLSAPALAAVRPAIDQTRDEGQRDVRVKGAKIAGYRGVGHAHDGMPDDLKHLAAKGTSLREILFGKGGKLTADSFREEEQFGAGDCYSQSTRAALTRLAPEREEQKFVGLIEKDGELTAVDLDKHPDFAPELHADGTFEIGVIQYKLGTDRPFVRVVKSQFPESGEGKLVMASVRDNAWWAIFAEQARADVKGAWANYANGGNATREMEAETGLRAKTYNMKLTGSEKADADMTERVWTDLKTAYEEGRVIVAGTDYAKDLSKRLKDQVKDGQRTEQSTKVTWTSTHMIEGHDQSVFHVGEDPVLETDKDGAPVLKNGKPVVKLGEDGKPKMERWIYIRNPWGYSVKKGEQVIDPHTGRNEGVYRISLKDAVAFFDQYYIGGNPAEMKKVVLGKLAIERD